MAVKVRMGEKEILHAMKQAVVMLMMQSQEGGSSGDEDDEEEEDDEGEDDGSKDKGNVLDGTPDTIYNMHPRKTCFPS